MTSNTSGSNREIEKKLVEDYQTELSDLAEKLQDVGVDESEDLQKALRQKLAIYEKQVSFYKRLFPHDEDLNFYESYIYVISASLKLGSTGFAHREMHRTDSTGAKLVYIAMAKNQNDSNAYEAIRLLERAIYLDDNPITRMFKASVHSSLKQKQAALQEVNYVLEHFADEQDLYLDARKLKDEIEQAEDKKCFIATAVYGSSVADEVILLRQFRNDILLQSGLGRKLVEFYYRYSPTIAQKLSNSILLRKLVKAGILAPIIWSVVLYTKIRGNFIHKECN